MQGATARKLGPFSGVSPEEGIDPTVGLLKLSSEDSHSNSKC